jgi:hypothetical protein
MDLMFDTETRCLFLLIACTWIGLVALNHRVSKILNSKNWTSLELNTIFANSIHNLEEQNVWLRKDMDRLVASLDKRFALKADAGFEENYKSDLLKALERKTYKLEPKKPKRKYTKRKNKVK